MTTSVLVTRFKRFFFQNISLKQIIAKNTIWLFSGEILSRLVKAAIVIYAARVLGVANWGVFSYAITIVGFFTIFCEFGLAGFLTRELVKDSPSRLKYISTACFIKLLLLAISFFLLITIGPILTKMPGLNSLLLIVSVILIFDSLREFSFSMSRALEKMEWEAIIRISTNVLTALLGFIFLYISPTVTSFASAYAVGSFLSFILAGAILRGCWTGLGTNFTRSLVWPIIVSAWPLALLGLLGGLMIHTDVFMIGLYSSSAAVGYYAIAQRIIQLVYTAPDLISRAFFPTYVRLAQKDPPQFRRVLEKSISLAFLFGLPMLVGGLFLAQEIVYFLFGTAYLPSTGVFRILLLTVVIVFPASLANQAIFAYHQEKKFFIFFLLGGLSNVVFNALLIPRFGIEGSAVATIISQLLAYGFIWIQMKKINYFSVLPYLKKILPATLIMAALVSGLKFLGLHFILNLSLSSLAYIG
ncbi:flippase, partial [Candidatus Uhrbacteria bacterium]|nr:flippase [Candidatus Uhrbacteria bacterium]